MAAIEEFLDDINVEEDNHYAGLDLDDIGDFDEPDYLDQDLLLEDDEDDGIADVIGEDQEIEMPALDGIDENNLLDIGDVQDHADDPDILENIYEPPEFEPGFQPEDYGYEDIIHTSDKLNHRVEIPDFAREMNLSAEDARSNRNLLRLLDANIDHREVGPELEKQRKDAAKKLYREKKGFLDHVQSKYEVSPFIIGSAPVIQAQHEMPIQNFVRMFEGGDPSRVVGEGFSSTGVIGGQYEEGVEKLESLARKEGDFETEVDYENIIQSTIGENLFHELNLSDRIADADQKEVESVIFDDLGQLIGQKMQENPEEGQELIQKRNKLKNQIETEKRAQALKYAMKEGIEDPDIGEKAYREIIESHNPDLSFLRQDNVKNMLESLADEHLSESCSTYHEAERLADNMDGREVEFEIYDKSFENMPYKTDRNLPCTFPGSSHASSVMFADYMLDPATQIGKISTNKGDGVALMKLVENEGDGYVYVHSVEADRGENIASDSRIAREIQTQIENYAEEISQYNLETSKGQEIDIEGIMYCMDSHNQGTASSFQNAVKEYENPDTEELELKHLGIPHNGFDNDIEQGIEVYQKPVS
jgi:hypothetical protein